MAGRRMKMQIISKQRATLWGLIISSGAATPTRAIFLKSRGPDAEASKMGGALTRRLQIELDFQAALCNNYELSRALCSLSLLLP